MKLDLHIHSKYSHDSFSDPAKILKAAKKRGLDAVAITDHNSFGAYEQLRKLPDPGVLVIPGMEIKTEKGDVIGLFLSAGVESRRFEDTLREIRGQGGIVVLPHPYRRKCDPRELIGRCDLVEVLNSRTRAGENEAALKLCESQGMKAVTGSDAHTYYEIGRSMTEINGYFTDTGELKDALLHKDRICSGKTLPFYVAHGVSFLSSQAKRMWGIT